MSSENSQVQSAPQSPAFFEQDHGKLESIYGSLYFISKRFIFKYLTKIPSDPSSLSDQVAGPGTERLYHHDADVVSSEQIRFAQGKGHLVGNLGLLRELFNTSDIPRTLQNANLLWHQPRRIAQSSRSACMVISETEDTRVILGDVRQPPGYFMRDRNCLMTLLERRDIALVGGRSGAYGNRSLTTRVDMDYLNIRLHNGEMPAQGSCVLSREKLWEAVSANSFILQQSGYYGLQNDLLEIVDGRFMNEVLRRIGYIDEFLSWEGEPFDPAGLAPGGSGARHLYYYPWLGPNVEFDCWLFRKGIVRQWTTAPDKRDAKQYRWGQDVLARMYGLGYNDLEFIRNNPREEERGQQIATVERLHILEATLGSAAAADIRKQFSFCSYAIRDGRAAHIGSDRRNNNDNNSHRYSQQRQQHQQLDYHPCYPGINNNNNNNNGVVNTDGGAGPSNNNGNGNGNNNGGNIRSHPRTDAEKLRDARAEARRREFKIAQILVDRVWHGVEITGTRTVGMQLRGDRGDWVNLGPADKRVLLGNRDDLIKRFM